MNGPSPDVLVVADGASIHTRRLLGALVERDVRVELATFETGGVAGVREHRLPAYGPIFDLRYLEGAFVLARVLRERRPPIIHAHYVVAYGAMAALALRLAGRGGTHLVQGAWGTDLLVRARQSRLFRGLATFALRDCDLVTGETESVERAARALVPRIRWHRFLLGPPAALIDADGPRDPLIVSMRRLDPDMRVDLAVRAFRHARQVAPAALGGWRLLVAGDGADARLVRDAAQDDPAIELAGSLDQAELRRRLLRARIQVMVPRSDAASAALLDGLAAGLIPIVNDLEGPREWVDETIGEIVPRDPTIDQVAAALIRAVLREVPRDRIRERVRGVTWEREVDGLVAAYRSLLPR